MLFGSPKVLEYIDTGNEIERIHRCVQLRHTDDLFHPNHWRLNLLNSKKDLLQAFTNYMQTVGLA